MHMINDDVAKLREILAHQSAGYIAGFVLLQSLLLLGLVFWPYWFSQATLDETINSNTEAGIGPTIAFITAILYTPIGLIMLVLSGSSLSTVYLCKCASMITRISGHTGVARIERMVEYCSTHSLDTIQDGLISLLAIGCVLFAASALTLVSRTFFSQMDKSKTA